MATPLLFTRKAILGDRLYESDAELGFQCLLYMTYTVMTSEQEETLCEDLLGEHYLAIQDLMHLADKNLSIVKLAIHLNKLGSPKLSKKELILAQHMAFMHIVAFWNPEIATLLLEWIDRHMPLNRAIVTQLPCIYPDSYVQTQLDRYNEWKMTSLDFALHPALHNLHNSRRARPKL